MVVISEDSDDDDDDNDDDDDDDDDDDEILKQTLLHPRDRLKRSQKKHLQILPKKINTKK